MNRLERVVWAAGVPVISVYNRPHAATFFSSLILRYCLLFIAGIRGTAAIASTMDSNTGVEDRGPQLTAVCIAFITLATIAVSLRAYVRLLLLKVFGVEDAFMIVAWVSQNAGATKSSVQANHFAAMLSHVRHRCTRWQTLWNRSPCLESDAYGSVHGLASECILVE